MDGRGFSYSDESILVSPRVYGEPVRVEDFFPITDPWGDPIPDGGVNLNFPVVCDQPVSIIGKTTMPRGFFIRGYASEKNGDRGWYLFFGNQARYGGRAFPSLAYAERHVHGHGERYYYDANFNRVEIDMNSRHQRREIGG